MITRPLDLASKLRLEPRSFDGLFFVNVALIGFFFALFSSRFVLTPGLSVEFALPQISGAAVEGQTTTHFITVMSAEQILTNDGLRNMEKLREWLNAQAKTAKQPSLLVRMANDVEMSVFAQVTDAARAAGFAVFYAAEEPASRPERGGL